MGLVEDEQRTVAPGQPTSPSRSAASPSIENTVSVTTTGRPPAEAERGIQSVEVPVGVHGHPGPGQSAPVDDRGVVPRVGEDMGSLAAEHRQHREVGGEPGREDHRPLAPLPGRQRRLELVVDRPRPGHQPRGPRRRHPTGRGPDGRRPPRPDGTTGRGSRWRRTTPTSDGRADPRWPTPAAGRAPGVEHPGPPPLAGASTTAQAWSTHDDQAATRYPAASVTGA